MSSLLHAMSSLLPYHLLSYGTLLGTQLYQSFVNTKLCFRHLPMPQFTQLQKRIFPVYFTSQVGLVILTAATHPPHSVLSLVRDPAGLTTLGVALVVDGLNWVVFGPKTSRAMLERSHQETRDGRSYRETDGISPDMKAVNRKFSRNHAMAIHLNAISMLATVVYGIILSSRLQL